MKLRKRKEKPKPKSQDDDDDDDDDFSKATGFFNDRGGDDDGEAYKTEESESSWEPSLHESESKKAKRKRGKKEKHNHKRSKVNIANDGEAMAAKIDASKERFKQTLVQNSAVAKWQN